MGGRAFDPEPRHPLSHSIGIGCFTPLPGSGWQVLFDSQHGSIDSEKSDTLQKMVAGQPEPDPQKKKTKYRKFTNLHRNLTYMVQFFKALTRSCSFPRPLSLLSV
jgi:hypothetical protein